ncbi:MAG: metallophosphoesterase [Rhodobacteraceae bacterium]|nr:metallophosphatase family protein [Alphaproteobacteria bacterium]NNK68642.1 metallophosphoesterase [Paracoccaceae bacterium]
MTGPVVQDLGSLPGDVVLFGGPYSNLQALEALADEVAGRAALCTGDVVAYCGDPAATVARMRALGWPVVAGNCERQLAAGAMDCGCGFDDGTACDLLSRGWYAHADAEVDDEARHWMDGLPDIITFTAHGKRYAAIHGGVTAINRFLWPVSPTAEFDEEIATFTDLVGPVDGIIAGHSGIPFVKDIAPVTWINAGAIGLPPHDGKPQTRYTVLGADGVTIRTLDYDVMGAVAAMEHAGLTQGYHRALTTGIWPSEDILPMELRR